MPSSVYSYTRLIFKPGFSGIFRVMPKSLDDRLFLPGCSLADRIPYGMWLETAWTVKLTSDEEYFSLPVLDGRYPMDHLAGPLYEKYRFFSQRPGPVRASLGMQYAFGVVWLAYHDPESQATRFFLGYTTTSEPHVLVCNDSVGERLLLTLAKNNCGRQKIVDEDGQLYVQVKTVPTKAGRYSYYFETMSREQVLRALGPHILTPQAFMSDATFQDWVRRVERAESPYIWLADDAAQERLYARTRFAEIEQVMREAMPESPNSGVMIISEEELREQIRYILERRDENLPF